MDRLREIRDGLAESRSGGPVVYVISAGPDLPHKIGASTAANLERRVADLSVGSPVPLEVIARAAAPRRRFDQEIHAILPRREWSHGEWFNLGPASWAALAFVGLLPKYRLPRGLPPLDDFIRQGLRVPAENAEVHS